MHIEEPVWAVKSLMACALPCCGVAQYCSPASLSKRARHQAHYQYSRAAVLPAVKTSTPVRTTRDSATVATTHLRRSVLISSSRMRRQDQRLALRCAAQHAEDRTRVLVCVSREDEPKHRRVP